MEYPKQLSENELYWYNLIQECRTSGMSDAQWLKENNIKSPTFYYHVKKLRSKACEIPESICNAVSQVQEVVPLVIEDLPLPKSQAVIPEPVSPTNEVTLRLTIQGVTMEITNQATQNLIQNVISALRYLC